MRVLVDPTSPCGLRRAGKKEISCYGISCYGIWKKFCFFPYLAKSRCVFDWKTSHRWTQIYAEGGNFKRFSFGIPIRRDTAFFRHGLTRDWHGFVSARGVLRQVFSRCKHLRKPCLRPPPTLSACPYGALAESRWWSFVAGELNDACGT